MHTYTTGGTDTYNTILQNNAAGTDHIALAVRRYGTDKAKIMIDGDFRSSTNSYGPISSDSRLKKNIKPLGQDSLDNISKLNPVNFDWKDKSEGEERQIGFIAQEVNELLPDIVTCKDTRTYDSDGNHISGFEDSLNIRTSHLIPYLVKSIQILEARVAELENKNE